MFRKVTAALVLLLLAVSAFAKDRSVSPLLSGASVTGEVSSVSGNLVSLAGGLVTVDASTAKILLSEGASTVAAIKPGMLITATVQDTGTVTTGPLVATTIAILRSAAVTFTGTIQSVSGSQLSLLGRTIRTDANTAFVNFGDSTLQANTLVIVEANVVAGALVATRITLIAPIPPRPQTVSGTVKSIGTDAWVITTKERDTTFVVNASTKILGEPKAGDKVEVVYTVDSAHRNVALTIIKNFEAPKVITFVGTVKSIGDTWVITRDDDHKDIVLKWPEFVRIFPVVSVGDRVRVVATENGDGTYSLITVVPAK